MSTADIAVIVGGTVNGTVTLAGIAAGWHLLKSGRVRVSSPTPAQLQAEREQPQAAVLPAGDRPVLEAA